MPIVLFCYELLLSRILEERHRTGSTTVAVARGLLVPAVMRPAGRANWWCPRILARDQARDER
ncbi:hypothetical protein AB0L99_26995 [Streptomyces sp. NPDC051954]|uniref:hypothetical protein n=1 Tax=unclassified Streptomyces TaxID=2593676 RepID=UPI0034492C24